MGETPAPLPSWRSPLPSQYPASVSTPRTPPLEPFPPSFSSSLLPLPGLPLLAFHSPPLLSVPGLAPSAAGPAGKGLKQGRCLDGTGRREGGGAAGDGARGPCWGGRGAHRRRPRAGRPPRACRRRRRGRAIPTPLGILAREKPGSAGGEEEVLRDPRPRRARPRPAHLGSSGTLLRTP